MPGHSALSFSEGVVALGRRDGHGERNQMETPPDSFVHRAKARLVVAGDDQLEGGDELEKVLPHEPRADLVAAGKRLDLCFGPAPALLGFARGDQTGATQSGEVGRMALGLRRGESSIAAVVW